MSSQTTAAGPADTALTMKSLAAMLLLAVMWGLSIPVTKLGLVTMPPLTLTALRFAIALPILLFLIIGRQRMPLRALPRVAGLGILGIGVGQVTQTLGVVGTSASIGTIISAAIPMFVVLFAALRLKQSISPRQLLGLVTAFAGIAIVASGNGSGASALQTSLSGAVLLLISALAVAFYYVWSVELTELYGTATVAAWSTLFGFLALMPWTAWEISHSQFEITVEAVASAAYLGVIVTAAGLFLWLKLLRTVPARTAASVQYLQPVVGVIASSLMFGDSLGLFFILGVMLVLVGLALTMAARRNSGA
ncbi:DMT family transporter [Lacibacterium aquatile]|uniref:DMT family transporter n=1 Tax=Lacibacterium aquatile TaxID=1168082 RepID=A0ABW5DLE0_9PROT